MQIAGAAPVLDPASGSAVHQRHARDLLSLPGALSTRWTRDAPDEILVRFSTDGFRRLADNVLRDVVDGVRLLLVTDDPSGPNPADDHWVNSPNEMVKAVAGMPGTVDAIADHEHGQRMFRITTVTQADTDRLGALVNPSSAPTACTSSRAAPSSPPRARSRILQLCLGKA